MGDSATRNNPEYYLGEPIWITAQKQGVKTGNMYWVGSDIAIKKSHPTYYRPWNAKPFLTFEQRIDTVLTWLQKPEPERPRLIMLYLKSPTEADITTARAVCLPVRWSNTWTALWGY